MSNIEKEPKNKKNEIPSPEKVNENEPVLVSEYVEGLEAKTNVQRGEEEQTAQNLQEAKKNVEEAFEDKEFTREFIEKIENSKLNAQDKVSMLLVKAGLKPAADIYLAVKGKTKTFLTDEDLESIKSLIKESGLAYNITEVEKDENQQSCLDILISRSQEKVGRLKELWQDPENKENSKEIGLLLGYPPSAVDAFVAGQANWNKGEVNERILDSHNLNDAIIESDAYAFSTFALSNDNWHNEIGTGVAWAEYVKSVSPKTYQEMMEMANKRKEKSQSLLVGVWNLLKQRLYG